MNGMLLSDEFVAELAAIVRHTRRAGLWSNGGRVTEATFPETPILVKNTETEEIPAYACMQVVGTLDEDDRNYVEVEKPDGNGKTYLFNGSRAIESEGYGVAQSGNRARAYKSSGTVTFGQLWRPTSGQWYLTQGSGRFPAIGEDGIASNVFWVRTDFNDIVHFKSPVGGIAAISTLTMGSATCDRYSCTTAGVLADSGEDITIYNAHSAFAASTLGTAALNDAGLWVAITENCS